MKFLTKVNRNYFFLISSIVIITIIASYFAIISILSGNARENLLEKELLIKNQVQKTGVLPNIHPIVEIEQINHIYQAGPAFREVTIRDSSEHEDEIFWEYAHQMKINDKCYSLKLRQSTFENEDLRLILTVFVCVLLVFVFIIFIVVSGQINKTIWSVFEDNLNKIEQFSFTNGQKLYLNDSDIEEFDRLNLVVERLTDKLNRDYLSLKEFSENASHEIQTPISIALLNLDEILQQDLNKETFEKVILTINALKRLSTLNQSLILLTKIENRQFVADKSISVSGLIQSKINEFSTWLEVRKIHIELTMKEDWMLCLNEQLADILVNNLLSNAIKYNVDHGKINITLENERLTISNTGKPHSLKEQSLFSRFTKGDSKSFGLGLAIVKNICVANNLDIAYQKTDLHSFTITPKR